MKQTQKINVLLEDVGIKPSFQRIKVYEFLRSNLIHPTIDDVYKELVKEIPTLSKTTVYNTVKLLEEKNLIEKVKINETEVRYDAKTEIHGHFRCNKCGEIFDFDYNYKDLKMLELKDFNIKKTNLNLMGECPKCNN